MTMPRELTVNECISLIAPGGVGRLALCTPMGPQIYPLNYVMDQSSIIFRTTPYSTLGTLNWGTNVAFEVDHLDYEHQRGWSVIATGRADAIDDPEEISLLREGSEPQPWAGGSRRLYIRLTWRALSGRLVGGEWLPAPRGSAPRMSTDDQEVRSPWTP